MKSNSNLADILNSLNLEQEFKTKTRTAEAQLEIETYKEELKTKLIEANENITQSFSDDNINNAIDDYFSNLNSFQLPKNAKGFGWAKAYINRKKIGLRYALPLVSAGLITGLIFAGINWKEKADKRNFETFTEYAVEQAYNQKNTLTIEAQNLNSTVPDKFLNRSELEGKKTIALEHLANTNNFFDDYCSDGTASDDVTPENAALVRQLLSDINAPLDKAESIINEGKGLIVKGRNLLDTRMNLDVEIGEIRTIEQKPEIYATKAENTYKQGVINVETKKIDAGKQSLQNLTGIKKDITSFINITTEYETIRTNINNVVIEQIAKERSQSLYTDMNTDIQGTNVVGMKKNIEEIKFLYTILNADAELKIVQRSGVKSGIDRYNGAIEKDYLIIEIVDKHTGKAIPQRIYNQETGKTETVTTFGWEVPESVFERVKKDKIDDRIIQNDKVGLKEKGYLTPKITFKDNNGRTLPYQRFITRW